MEFRKAEYEMQHFGFSVEQIRLEHHLLVKKCIEKLTNNFAEYIIKKTKIKPEAAEEITKNVDSVVGNISESFNKVLTKFDQLLEQEFSIPDNVLLLEDMKHERNYTVEDEENYRREVEELENNLKQNAFLIASWTEECEAYEQLIPVIDKENYMAEEAEKCLKTKIRESDAINLLEQVKEVLAVKEEALKSTHGNQS